MHELPVTQGILDVVIDAAHQAGSPQIISIDLVIGDMSSIVDDSVQFYFDILSRGTLAEGASLNIRRVSATATCSQCGHVWNIQAPLVIVCPVCDSSNIHVTGGREFYVDSIEVE